MGSHTSLIYHVIFSTRYRRRTIRSEFRERLHAYMGGTVRGLNGIVLEVGGVDDHVHLLVGLSPKFAVSDVIRDIKANSSRWTNQLPAIPNKFQWQRGYAAFTVSQSQVEVVANYVRKQPEHHRKLSFTEEYLEFLKRHQIEFDARYVFDDEFTG